MYFPILRGRQNELLAVRELIQTNQLRNVIPVIEPVKASSTLLSTLKAASEAQNRLMVIANPSVGTFASDVAYDAEYCKRYEIALQDADVILVYRPSEEEAFCDFDCNEIAYFFERGSNRRYERLCERRAPDYSFVEAGDSRQRRRALGETISLEARFRTPPRNADYREHADDFLSEEHLYYKEDGYCGFSDYSIIGEEYNEGGFMPQVVAIHLTYFGERGEVRVRHFTSGDGFGDKDIAGKFSDALRQLSEWATFCGVPSTEGLKEYREIFESGRFPGLGYAKKLSLKHHMEMMNGYLEDKR